MILLLQDAYQFFFNSAYQCLVGATIHIRVLPAETVQVVGVPHNGEMGNKLVLCAEQ